MTLASQPIPTPYFIVTKAIGGILVALGAFWGTNLPLEETLALFSLEDVLRTTGIIFAKPTIRTLFFRDHVHSPFDLVAYPIKLTVHKHWYTFEQQQKYLDGAKLPW